MIKDYIDKGTLIQRGLYTEEELSVLIKFVLDQDYCDKALEIISHFLSSEKESSGYTLCRDVICSGITKSKEAVRIILEKAQQGKISIHTDISEKEVNIEEGLENEVYIGNWNKKKSSNKKICSKW